MAEIRLLDTVTIGQIAAGEIIERPLSVVKELVENAVDAGATRITVSIEQGGMQSIEVADDGAGIVPSQLRFAVQRHATSKLAEAHDLESIGTLGFRGEGLASIAAVSQLTVISRQRQADIGAQIRAHADFTGEMEPAAAPLGTRVRANDLFKNVPVRREYLRSAATEFQRISSWLSMFALGYPHITFSLRHDGKDVWTMPGSEDIHQRLAMVFGRGAVKNLIPLQSEAASSLNGTLAGFISIPGTDRPDRRLQLLFINGRLLRSTLLAGAWTAGYATFAMIGRHPFGVVFLDLPPDHVDPNVHPTKSDVRLRYGTQTFDAVRRSISATLKAHAGERFRENTDAGEGQTPAGISPHISLFVHAAPFSRPASGEANVPPVQERHEDAAVKMEEYSGGPRLRVLAQINASYILVTDGSAVLLFDQHAAHERVAYEQIVRRAKEHSPSEALLVPLILELDAAASTALDRASAFLREAGLEVEAFGDRTYRVTATPAGYGARPFDMRGFLDDLTDDPKQRDVRERIWASLACHSVTVAGERLELEEMQMLVDRLAQCQNPMHCPHGRPTLVRLSPDDLARLFKRQ